MAEDDADQHHPHRDAFREWAPVATEGIAWEGPNGTLMGAWASAGKHAKGDALVIHENRERAHHRGRRPLRRGRLQRASGLDTRVNAFFNHTGARFNAPAAAEAWRRVTAWFND